MKALVAGGTGFIGAHLVRALLAQGHEVVVLLRDEPSDLWRLLELKDQLRLLSHAECSSESGIDICYNLASYGVNHQQSRRDLLVDGNIHSALRLLELCRGIGIPRFIHTGSGFEYRNTGAPLEEGTEIHPANLYGAAKAAATHMVLAYGLQLGVRVTVLRPFSAFGPMEGLHRFIPQVMAALLEREPLRLSPGGQVRDYLYVEDLASAFVRAGQVDLPQGAVYNICGDQAMSLKALVDRLCMLVAGEPGLFEFGGIPYRPGEMMHYVGSDHRFRSDTGWAPQYSLDEGLRRTFEWYSTNLERWRV